MSSEHRPRLLDLFCGAGGAAVGYARAGFEVVGVDIKPQPRYPFEFVQADALEFLQALIVDYAFSGAIHTGTYYDNGETVRRFDAIHASPPCQAFTTMSNRHGSKSPELIVPTRDLLKQSGLPYVIENVPGALRSMRNPVRLSGEMFGLRVHRARLFETNWMMLVPYPPSRQDSPVAVYGKNDQRRLWTRADGSELRAATLKDGSEAMGIDWMTWDELREAIPPAYSELIGHQLMQHVRGAEKHAMQDRGRT